MTKPTLSPSPLYQGICDILLSAKTQARQALNAYRDVERGLVT